MDYDQACSKCHIRRVIGISVMHIQSRLIITVLIASLKRNRMQFIAVENCTAERIAIN